MDWDELKKIAETNKFNAEANKAEAEKLKVDFETAELKKEAAKKWWLKRSFRAQILSVFIGISIIGFYITYVVVPASNVENMSLKLENQKAELRIFNAQKTITLDSQTLAIQIKDTDSLNMILSAEINNNKKRDSIYKRLIQNYENDKANFSSSFKQLAESAKALDLKYNESQKRERELSKFQMSENNKLMVRIVSDKTGELIPNVQINLKMIVPLMIENYLTTVVRDGKLSIGLSAGEYVLTCEADGFMYRYVQFTVDYSKETILKKEFRMNPK